MSPLPWSCEKPPSAAASVRETLPLGRVKRRHFAIGVALAIVVAGALVRVSFLNELGTRAPFLTYYPAVALAALFGGFWPGVAATLASALLARYFSILPLRSFAVAAPLDQAILAGFVFSGVIVSWTAELSKQAHRAARRTEADRREEVERLVTRRTAELVETTQALQAEAALRRGLEERFRRVFESAPIAMIMVDDQGAIELANAEAERLFGYSGEELLGLGIERLLPERFRGPYAAATPRGPMDEARDLYALRKDGSEVPLEIGRSPLQTPDGVKVITSIVDLSKRKDMERALSESEERMRLTLDSIEDQAIVMLDARGRIVSWNAGAQRLTGYAKEEVLGHPFSLFHVRDGVAAGDPEPELIAAASDGRFEDEGWRLRKDGCRYLAHVVINAVRDLEGELRGFVQVTRDITEAKRIETSLIEANRRFALASGAARLGFWELEIPTRLLSWDDQMFELYGLPRTEGPQPNVIWIDRLHPEDRASAVERVRAAIDAGRDFEIEYRIVRPDGGVRHLRSAATVGRDADGRATRLFGVNFDMTERKRLETALRDSNERFALAAEAAGIGFYDWDLDSQIGRWDEQMYRLYGVSSECGENPFDLWKKGVHPDDRGAAEARLREANARVEAYKYEFRIVRPDGEVRHLRGASAIKPDAATGRRRLFGLSFDVTERKRLEAELIDGAQRFAMAAQAAGLGVWDYDIEAGALRWDDQMYRLYGFEPLQGEQPYALWTRGLHPEDRARAEEVSRQAIEEGRDYQTEFRILRPDGEVRHLRAAASLRRDADGRVKRMVGVNFDITERKRIETELIDSNERFVVAAEAAGLGFWEYDIASGAIRWDAQMFEIRGMDPDDDRHDPHRLNYVHPDDRARVEQDLLEAAAGRKKFNVEYRIVLDGDRVRHMKSAASLQGDPAGADARLLGVSFDITERKAIEDKIVEANERFALAAEAAGLGFWDFDIETQESHWDGQMYRLYGLPPDAALDVAARRSRLHPDDRARVDQELRDAAVALRSFESEYRIVQPDGRVRHIRSAASPKRDATGRAVRLLGVSFDVTERKEALEALEQARDAAEAANRAKSDFLAVMSHEIRTPMNGIMGMNALLLDTKLTKRQRRMTETIQESAESLLTIIDDVLDISKLESGKIDLEEVDFDLPHLIHKIVDLFAPRAAQKQLTTSADATAVHAPALRGDASRLRQILLNLVSNAIKFTASGSVAVTASTTDVGASETRVRVEVRDSGPGVGEEAKTRLFKPFEQADSSIRRRFGGTGLGLSICKRLVERMGGEIGVADRDGGGSIFWFEVVLRRAEAHIAEARPAPAEAPEPGARSGRILLAEDNAMNIEIARTILERAGYEVDVAVNGDDAVTAVRWRRYDLVLMDMHMPQLDGLAATRAIRALKGDGARVPIVAMTANAMQADQRRCLEAGMDDYFSKPFQPVRLVEKVAAWVGKFRAPPAPTIEADPTGIEALPVVEDAASEMLLSCFPRPRFKVLLRRFLTELEKDQEAFPRLARSSALPEMREDAHKLIASSGHFGARQVQKLATDLQSACETGDTASVSALVEQLAPASVAAAEALLAKYPFAGAA